MTLEHRCSNCGTLLQTTNANPLHDEIERLRAALQEIDTLSHGLQASAVVAAISIAVQRGLGHEQSKRMEGQ